MQGCRSTLSRCPLLPDVMWGDYYVVMGSALSIPSTFLLAIIFADLNRGTCGLQEHIVNDYFIGTVAFVGYVSLIIGIATKTFGTSYLD